MGIPAILLIFLWEFGNKYLYYGRHRIFVKDIGIPGFVQFTRAGLHTQLTHIFQYLKKQNKTKQKKDITESIPDNVFG